MHQLAETVSKFITKGNTLYLTNLICEKTAFDKGPEWQADLFLTYNSVNEGKIQPNTFEGFS